MTVNRSGWHFLQIPGPTNVPDRILHAMAHPTVDHRGPDFPELTQECIAGLKKVFQTRADLVIYPASGTGAWEAALANTLSPGDRVLMFETGHFAALWREMAQRLGLDVEFIPGDWRHGVDVAKVDEMLAADREQRFKAVMVVHNETSTGVTSDIAAVRAAIDRSGHPALFMVDTISSLGSMDYRHDEWQVDVTVAGSQKGLMLPPGLSFNAISRKARSVAENATLPRSYWDWEAMLASNERGYFPYTPATNLLFGLREALRMLQAEGLPAVFARHARLAEATRRAVRHWELEILCANPDEYSNSLTAVMLPDGHDEAEFRAKVLQRFDLSLGSGLGKVKGRVFRIGHLGHFNDLMLCATLSGVEMGLTLADIPHRRGGVDAAMTFLQEMGKSADSVTRADAQAT